MAVEEPHVARLAPATLGQGVTTVNAGAYTGAQADRGFGKFLGTCAQCHGVDLGGVDCPPLVGAAFIARWPSVGELFDHVLEFMPADNPGTLDGQATADLVAYILQANGYPAGTKELPAADPAMRSLRIEPRR